jgi:hypothetical protein
MTAGVGAGSVPVCSSVTFEGAGAGGAGSGGSQAPLSTNALVELEG